jgi:hypothetical protein
MKKRKPGPPAHYGRRPTLTIRLQMPLYRMIKKSAAKHGKSISEEIEDRLGRDAEAAISRPIPKPPPLDNFRMNEFTQSVITPAVTAHIENLIRTIINEDKLYKSEDHR